MIPVTGIYGQPWWTKVMFANLQPWIDLFPDQAAARSAIAIGYAEEDMYGFPRIVVNPESVTRNKVGLALFNTEAIVHVSLQMELDPASIGAESLEDEMNWFTQLSGDIACAFETLSLQRIAVDGEYPRELLSMSVIEQPDRVPAEEVQQFMPNAEETIFPVWVLVWEISYVP